MNIFQKIAKFFANLFPSRRKKRKEVREIQRRRYRDRPLREDGIDIKDAKKLAAIVSSDDTEVIEFGCIDKVEKRNSTSTTEVEELPKVGEVEK